MSVFTRIAAAVAVVGSFALAAPAAQAHYENTYFPLHVGNEWTYQKSGFAWQGTQKATVDASWVDATTGYIWFRTRSYNGNYHWLRQTSISRIYEFSNRQWYRLGAGPGYPWGVALDASGTHGGAPCYDGSTAEVVSRNEQVTVPAGTFSTIHVSYRNQCADAGITDEWFAKGVGLVKRAEQSIGGPRYLELTGAKISGRTIGLGSSTTPPVRVVVQMPQRDFYENHMPGPGPRPTQGPEITVQAIVHPTTSRDVTVNFPDYNMWDVSVTNPDGTVVWQGPRIMAPTPVGGVNKVIPVAGLTADHKFRMAFGAKQGTYTVKVKFLGNGATYPEQTTTFTMGWAF